MDRIIQYRDYTVTLTDDYTFEVSGAAWDEKYNSIFSSLRDAKSAIDGHLERKAKQNKTAAVTRIPARDSRGTAIVVRGINSTTGDLLVSPVSGQDPVEPSEVYPEVPWVAKLLIERGELMKRSVQIANQLRPYRVNGHRSYHRIKVEQYQGKMDELIKELNDVTANAARAGMAAGSMADAKEKAAEAPR